MIVLIDRLARWFDLQRRRGTVGDWRGPGARPPRRHLPRRMSLPLAQGARGSDEPADTQPLIFSDEDWARP